MNQKQREILEDLSVQMGQLQALVDTIAVVARSRRIADLRDDSLAAQLVLIDEKVHAIKILVDSDALLRPLAEVSAPLGVTIN